MIQHNHITQAYPPDPHCPACASINPTRMTREYVVIHIHLVRNGL